MELFKAHHQWATRPADQRFASLKTLYDACKGYAATAREKMVNTSELVAEVVGGELGIRRQVADASPREKQKDRVPAFLTNWAFKQLCGRVSAPADYIATLPATLAAQNLNVGLKKYADKREQLNMLFHQNGGLLCRALMTEVYERIWNWEVAERLLRLEQRGWEPARPDFNAGDDAFPSLYASDHDMFAFIRMKNVYIQQPVPGAKDQLPMYRGIIYENSEVGAKSIRATYFYYNAMCGNHIIWGASNVTEIAARHVGRVRDRLYKFDIQLLQHANDSTSDDQQRFVKAAKKQIAATKEDVLDALFGLRAVKIPYKTLEAAYDAVLPDKDGDPRTVWGMVQGLTRHSQTIPYTDQRTVLDRAAGQILDLVDKF